MQCISRWAGVQAHPGKGRLQVSMEPVAMVSKATCGIWIPEIMQTASLPPLLLSRPNYRLFGKKVPEACWPALRFEEVSHFLAASQGTLTAPLFGQDEEAHSETPGAETGARRRGRRDLKKVRETGAQTTETTRDRGGTQRDSRRREAALPEPMGSAGRGIAPPV
ncbi:hypothetical protein AAY473_026961 [Plecturocebus cupreus]